MSDGFLGRWSRRKADAREGRNLAEPERPARPATQPGLADAADTKAAAVDARETGVAAPAAPPPTLDDVTALTPASDFRRFVAPDVAPEVRNAAVRKLFADPHFNVMDGLDTYIDDYSRPDPLPAAMMRRMASAQFLRLVDEDATASPAPADSAARLHATGEDADIRIEPDVSQSGEIAPPCAAMGEPAPAAGSATAASTHEHAHADLRLQPDHAPPAPGAGGGPQ